MGTRFATPISLLVLTVAAGRAFAEEPQPPAATTFNYLPPAQMPLLPSPPKHYSPPDGFAFHRWGDLRMSFEKLPAEPAVVLATWTRGKELPHEVVCTGIGSERCTNEDFIRSASMRMRQGDGFHVLSEYFIESQGYKFPESGVVLHPVVYQFCANWHGMRKKVPQRFDSINEFCGMRMLFETETVSQLRALPEDHVTRYDLVLAQLISRYGKPANFTWRGRVTVESVDGPPLHVPSADRRFSTWRWCPAPRDGLMTRCEASIVLSIDPELGRGIVLFSTPALWQYAYAREYSSAQPDPLFTLIHALSFKHRTAQAQRKAAHDKAPTSVEAAKPAGLGGGATNSSATGTSAP